ncbi:UNVERIFIED_ORG: hypothetical protein J2X79_000217 [Arthrobacter globiformis]|nr:hypothetical protein [Arthrobacter globiformis]
MTNTPDHRKTDPNHAGAEPPLWTLARLEAGAGFRAEQCPHCRVTLELLAGPGTSVEAIHEPGCPALIAAENPPAIIGYPYPDDPRIPPL